MSIGSPGIDSDMLLNGCMVVFFLELCANGRPRPSGASSCATLLIPRGLEQTLLIAEERVKRLVDERGPNVKQQEKGPRCKRRTAARTFFYTAERAYHDVESIENI